MNNKVLQPRRRCVRGAAAVEMALVMPIFVSVVMGIIEFGRGMMVGQIVTNATFQPVVVYGLVALIYFCMCFPLTYCARMLERRLSGAR